MGKLILIIVVIAIVIVACWQIYNHRKEEEAFWTDKHTSIKPIDINTHDILQKIVKILSRINEIERGMQMQHERLNNIESKLNEKH